MVEFFKDNQKLSTIIGFIALTFSIWSFSKSCITERELKETNYSLAAVEYRPRLNISSPEILDIRLDSDSIPIKQSDNEADSIGNISFKISFNAKLKTTNIGNSVAKIIGWAVTDTLTEEPILKQILNDKSRYSLDNINELKLTHQYQEIMPGDSTTIRIKYSPQFVQDNRITIHLIPFYQNELNQLFDTYYWLFLKTNEIILSNPEFYIADQNKMNKFNDALFRIIEVKDINNYSSTYSEKQKDILEKNVN